ncbi:MAG: ACT domain-containing protein [Victivallaceae bacterium]
MKITQLSLFLENKAGMLSSACQVLKKANINIRTLALADTQQFGILRLLIKEWEQAKSLLEQAGFIVKVTEVLALRVEDRPGGLADILEALSVHHINIEYMYAFAFGQQDSAVIVFRFEDTDKALAALEKEDIDVVKAIELFK